MSAQPAAARRWLLFVAGGEPNSTRARENLEALQRAAGPGCAVEVVDVLEDFQRALEHDVLVTPSLIQLEPAPRVTVLGALSDARRVAAALGLELAPGDEP
jgi:circadian clock protein KaiB